ncbi:MAG: DNA repair protein RecO [Clostridia bacterium]|nr:DNA repair protein RecO [Clostridia bacterium]
MKYESVDGLVLRTWDKAPTDRYLSVLTAKLGRISILSKGSRSMKGEQMAISQPFAYCNFEFYRRGETNILKGGELTEGFHNIGSDVEKYSLASYLCEVVYDLTDEGEEAGEILRLLLNSLYAISNALYPFSVIKSAFEFRVAIISGFAPELGGCAECGSEDGELYFDVMNGAVLCAECLRKRGREASKMGDYGDDLREADVLCPLSPASFAALRYVATAPLSRLFAFELKDGEDLRLFASATETYLLSHVGHGFGTLDFYANL